VAGGKWLKALSTSIPVFPIFRIHAILLLRNIPSPPALVAARAEGADP
jgi:hypothetical protein